MQVKTINELDQDEEHSEDGKEVEEHYEDDKEVIEHCEDDKEEE